MKNIENLTFGLQKAAMLVLLIVFGFAAPAQADVKVDITRGVVEPIPIAIPSFFGSDGNESQYGRDIAQVVSNDLVRSGLFSAVDPRSFMQDANSLLVQPHFADWRVLNTQALVVGKVEAQPDGRLKVHDAMSGSGAHFDPRNGYHFIGNPVARTLGDATARGHVGDGLREVGVTEDHGRLTVRAELPGTVLRTDVRGVAVRETDPGEQVLYWRLAVRRASNGDVAPAECLMIESGQLRRGPDLGGRAADPL